MTSVNTTTFLTRQTTTAPETTTLLPEKSEELATGVALVSLAILLCLIALVLAIVTPSGFCSIRRRWIRRMKRVFGAASQTLMTEIRGEEFYAVPLEDMALDSALHEQDKKETIEDGNEKSNAAARERDMIAMYKQRGLL